MAKIPAELRETIAWNIRVCRMRKYPGRGGGKKCAEQFGVSPQQWSPWERGMRTPEEARLSRIAEFFGVTVEYLRRDNRARRNAPPPERQREPPPEYSGGDVFAFMRPHAAPPPGCQAGGAPDATGGTVYVPVFVLLPYLPEDMKALYDQFSAAMNAGRTHGAPSA